MQTPYTLPGDGSPIFVQNAGVPIRGYTVVNGTDQAAFVLDGLGETIDRIGPSTKSVGRGNWQSLTAQLGGLAGSGLCTLLLSDQTPDSIGQTTAVQSKVLAVTGNIVASGFTAVPSGALSEWSVDSGDEIPDGATFALAYLSLLAVPQSSSTLAVITARWRLLLRAGALGGTVITFGGISIGAAATPPAPIVPAGDARPPVVGVAGSTVQLDVDRRDPATWAVNALVAGFQAIFVPVNT